MYEFNPTNNTYTKKADFTGGAAGMNPRMMLKANNGKFYGSADGGTPYFGNGQNHPNGSGILYEFDPVTNAITPKHEFRAVLSTLADGGEYGTLTLKAGNGKLYGNTSTGIYSYDPVLDSVELHARLSYIENPKNLVEICRKPGYTHNPTTQYTVCAGTHFRYDLNNDNATTVTWLHNGSPDPTQTASVLEFNAITAAQAGTWSCTLTNACGSTVPPTITITVNPAGPGTVTSSVTPAGPLMICPGSSVTLSGNNGGTWNTGATTPTLTVSTPGIYRVTNTNVCGSTYSNIVQVDTIPSPAKPVATGGNTYVCPGGTWTLGGNTNGGTWSNGATTESITVPVVAGNAYYITNTHTCGTDTSNVIPMEPYVFYDTSVSHLLANGPLTFCEGGSVTLNPAPPINTWADFRWFRVENGGLTYLNASPNAFTITQGGTYIFRQSVMPCGIEHDDTLTVTVDTLSPTPIISPLGPTVFCEGDSVVLQSNIPNSQWNTGETASSITVMQAGTYTAGIYNTCGNVTSTAITVTTIPAPTVGYTAPITQVCTNGGNVLLTGGTPAGGVYSGTGVSGGQYFVPTTAGTGTHTITYTYSDGTCPASATQQISVVAPQQPILLSNHTDNTFCEGGNLLLFQTQYPVVQWNTGAAAPVLLVNQPGTYSYTATDACGTVTSNSITVLMNPTSASANPQTICAGQTYTFNGHAYTATGTYTDVFTNAYGCDSTVTTQLTVTQAPFSTNPQTICAGQTYTINGHSYTATGTYTDTLQTAIGCDSLIITQLTVTPPPNSNNPQTICAGASYTFNGHTYTAAGNYIDVFSLANGCDSTVTTQLTVTPAPGSNNPQSICEGESYTINGHTYTSAGTYTDTFQNAAGCDSIVSTLLTVTQVNAAITQNGTQLTATPSGAAYQWINCGNQSPITGATSQTYTVTANGSYAVAVTLNNCSDTSACQTVSTASMQEWAPPTTITLYPNPASEWIWLQSDVPLKTIRVYNTVGQCVYRTQNSNRADVAALAPGTYFVTVETETGSWNGKFVKQ